MMRQIRYYYVFGEGSKINQILCALLINLAMFVYGASIGWMSPMTLLLQSMASPRETPLSDSVVSWMAAAPYIIAVPSNFVFAYMADRVGRKLTLLLISFTAVGCWIIKLSSMETWAFLLARALIGLNMAGCYLACPMYTKEICQDSIRGVLCSLVILFHTTGNLFAYVIGDMLNYRTVLWICLSLPSIHMLLLLMMPESPCYLVKKGKPEEAGKIIAWLMCRSEDDSIVQGELNRLKREQEKDDETSRFALRAVLSDKILFRAFRIAIVVTLTREVCGAIPVTNFAGDIFDMTSDGSGMILTPNQQAMMLGAVQVAGSMAGSSVVDRLGRKPLLFVTSLVSGLSMCALASWFLARTYGFYGANWMPVVTLCLCIFCDAFGLLPVAVVIIGEIFSFKYRGTVIATAMAVSTLSDFFQLLFFKPVANTVGVHAAFYFFGVVCLLAALYVFLVIPETKRRGLEEIYEKLKTKKERALERE